ncbi:retrovirus-related pol polyprotein from transposon TNT 1-94, partial [Tanacetum coccineum]
NGAVFIGRKTQQSLGAVPAVPDISGGCQAYKGAAQQTTLLFLSFCGESCIWKDDKEIVSTSHFDQIEEANILVKSLRDYLKACGIVQQHIPPYNNTTQDYLETMKHTLLDMVRSMMNLTTLSLSFWDYALESAIRILNMVLTKKRCEALVKRDTPVKLQQRYVKCIFIGYPKEMMGYYFYFPPENKIVVARTLRTPSSGNTSTVQCYNCSGKGHYARNCPKPRVRDSKYFMEQMLLAKQDEAEFTIDHTSDDGPSCESAFISEVQSSSIDENNEQMYPTHTKIINSTIGNDQINSNIKFDSFKGSVNSGSVEKDTHVPDLCAIEKLARNAYQEAKKQQIFAQQVQKQNTHLTSQLEMDIKEMKDVFESTESELDELEKQNDLLKDQLLEASLKHDVELSGVFVKIIMRR